MSERPDDSIYVPPYVITRLPGTTIDLYHEEATLVKLRWRQDGCGLWEGTRLPPELRFIPLKDHGWTAGR
jgi:hypothetical protein